MSNPVHEDSSSWGYELSGTWQFEGAPSWLDTGISADLLASGTLLHGEHQIEIAGGLTLGGVSVFFDDFSLDDEVCGGMPQGRMLVRDPSGGWFELWFGKTCDGCAEVWYTDDLLGTVCADLTTPLTAMSMELMP